MRKFLLICLMAIGYCSASLAQLNMVPDVEYGQLQEGDIVAIYNKATTKLLYGSGAQNLGYGLVDDACGEGSQGWLWKVEEAEGHLLFLLQKSEGGDYGVWGSPGYLNAQPGGGWCCFILGLHGEDKENGGTFNYGTDGENCALWDIEAVEGGFKIKNVSTQLYLNDNGAANHSEEEAVVWTFCTLADISPLKSDKVKILESWIVNGDFEGDDLSSFPFSYDGPNNKTDEHPEGTAVDPLPIANEGPDGSKCAKITSFPDPTESWHTQLYLRTNEEMPKGTEFLLKMTMKADEDNIKITTSGQAEPRTWKGGVGLSDFYVDTEWKTYSMTGKIDCDDFHSLAIDLSNGDEEVSNTDGTGTAKVNRSVTFWFDNIEFGTYEKAPDVQHNAEAVRVLFPDYTNIPDMISAAGKTRWMFPVECVSVTVNGEVAPVSSVEADKKGQFMIFFDEDWLIDNNVEFDKDTKIVVKFTNPTGANNVTYLDEDKTPVKDFEGEVSAFNEDLELISFAWAEPELVSSDPENGSFNLAADISEFKVTFDKKVRSAMLEAKLDGKEKLTVSPQEPAAEITFTRTATTPLAEGEHVINITKVYTHTNYQIPEGTQDAPVTLTFSIGEKSMSPELLTAIQEAQTMLATALEDELDRYVGVATTALSEAIAKYEAEGTDYTAPSVLRAAVKDLKDKTQALSDHMALCDSYDSNLAAAEQIVLENASTKFANHNAYKALAEVVAQYSGKDPLTDDELLTPAVAVLSENVKMAGYLFTEGESGLGDCGVKVLTESLRSGAETLMALGAAEDDEAVVAAQNALTDNQDLAVVVQNNVKLRLYEALKDEATAADLFVSEEPDEDSGEILPAKYDMSVFIQNPNIYSLDQDTKGKDENVPGWHITGGTPGLYCRAWGGGDRGIANLPQDCAFSNWCGNERMEQTITNLAVGVYTLVIYGENWSNQAGNGYDNPSFAFYRLSSTLTPDEDVEDDTEDIYFEETQNLTFNTGNVQGHAYEFENIEVTDGYLNFGIQFKHINGIGNTQNMFDRVKLYLTGAVPGHNYAEDYEQIKTGVNTAKAAKVRAIELYDLNGRRVSKTQKGLNIVKRVMSDGSVQTSKVVK